MSSAIESTGKTGYSASTNIINLIIHNNPWPFLRQNYKIKYNMSRVNYLHDSNPIVTEKSILFSAKMNS